MNKLPHRQFLGMVFIALGFTSLTLLFKEELEYAFACSVIVYILLGWDILFNEDDKK